MGLPIICIDARHAKAALKMQINKSDRNDAVGIARIMQCGWYKEVRVKDLDSHAIKALLVSRALLVKIKRGDRLDGPNLEMRRCDAAKLPLRGSQCPAHPRSKVVDA